MSIQQLIDLQNDQIRSQYRILFPTGIPGGYPVDPMSLTLRQDMNFPWPTREVSTYDVFYQGVKITKTGVLDNTDKKFTLEFRLDENWQIFNTFQAWYKKVFDEQEGLADNEAATRTKLIVQMLGANHQVTKQVTYNGIKIYSLGQDEPEHTSGDPMRVKVGFIYYWADFG